MIGYIACTALGTGAVIVAVLAYTIYIVGRDYE